MRQLDEVQIFLRNQKKGDLEILHKKITGELPDKKLTTQELFFSLSRILKIEDLISKWESKFGVFNTSVTVFGIINDERKLQKKLRQEVEENLGDKWDELFEDKNFPEVISGVELLRAYEVNNSIYFLFAEKGRTRYVLNMFDYDKVLEPKFSLGVWNDKDGVIEVRGPGNHDKIVKKITDLLKFKSKYVVKPYYIDDNETLKLFAKEIKGQVIKVRLKDAPQSSISMAELTGKPLANLLETDEYLGLKGKGFLDNAGGVSLTKPAVVIWVGYKSKTVWLQKGSFTEELLRKIVKAYREFGTLSK